MTASAFISPPGVFIISYSHTLKRFTGLILAKKPESRVIAESVLFFLKISNRKGLKSPREIKEKILDSTLKLKYETISLGYFDT